MYLFYTIISSCILDIYDFYDNICKIMKIEIIRKTKSYNGGRGLCQINHNVTELTTDGHFCGHKRVDGRSVYYFALRPDLTFQKG